MKSILIRIALWILRHYGFHAYMIPPELNQILLDAGIFVNKEDIVSAEGTSGEYKRHRVYAALQKKYPNAARRDLAIAIELAIQGIR